MTDPTKALADAARSLIDGVKDTFLEDAARVRVLEHALAAYDAAQASPVELDTDRCADCGYPRDDHHRRHEFVSMAEAATCAIPNRRAPLDSSTHADTREGWEWREEVFRLRKEKDALLQVARDGAALAQQMWEDALLWSGPVASSHYRGEIADRIRTLRAEVERASKGGAA